LLLSCPRPDYVSNHQYTGGNADAHAQPSLFRGDLADCFDNGKGCENRALSVRLIGSRPAKIDQDAVSHEASNETTLSLHGRCNERLVGADHLQQVFRVELCRKCSGADQIAEHHGNLPTLGS
jgi:hypothetical protein